MSATRRTRPTEPPRGTAWLLSKARRLCPSPRSAASCPARSWPAMTFVCDLFAPRCAMLPSSVPHRDHGAQGPRAAALWISGSLALPHNHGTTQAHDVADHLRHRLVMFQQENQNKQNKNKQNTNKQQKNHKRDAVL